MTRIFVYGTLRRGRSNHHHLEAGRFLGDVRTLPLYRVLPLDPHPGLGAGDERVPGELWEVTAEHLALLDAFEGVPSYFDRRQVLLEGHEAAEAYFWAGDGTSSPSTSAIV